MSPPIAMKRAPLRLLAAVALLAACGEQTSAPSVTYPGIDGHAKYLPLVGTSHDPATHPSVTCEACHPGTTFREPVCTGCHARADTTALHTAASGAVLQDYAWTPPPSGTVAWQPPSCLRCHPEGGVTSAFHDRYFPVGRGTAHDRSCGACHGDPLDKANVSKLRCVTCHSSAAVAKPLPAPHAGLLRADSYPASPSPADCLRCHDLARVDRIASHGARRGPTGYGRAGPWDGDAAADCSVDRDACKHGKPGSAVHCFSCHDAPPPAFGGKGAGIPGRPWAQDWKIPATTAGQTGATSCRGCHGPT